MRRTLAALAVLFGSGCSVISSSGLSNGGAVKHHDAGGGTTTGGAAPGSPCASDGVCSSGVCGLAGSGNCCAKACSSTDPTCAATGCDDGGACDYAAAGTSCGPSSCSDRVQSNVVCDGYGKCGAENLAYCAYGLLCDDAGVACLPKCTSSADCLKDSKCNAGVCVTPEPVGPCTENDDCMSGYCGVAGTGHCCVGPCSTDTPCGATDCDPSTGVCDYASDVVCAPASCDGGMLEPPRVCNGLGACPLTQAVSCAPYACNAATDACATSCGTDGGCFGGYCDIPSGACCGVPSGGRLNVDSEFGSDLTVCCGAPGFGACQTLGHAMYLIDQARAQDVTIQASIPTTSVWAPPGEVYPIVLGWGAELLANQTTFQDGDGGNRALFEIGALSPNDHVGYASIVGAYIGGDQPNDPSAILVDPGSTLYLAGALVCSSLASKNNAIEVSAGGALVLGRDHPGVWGGLVSVATASTNLEGYDGIVCDSANNLGCTITDFAPAGQSSLSMVMQTHRDIDAEDFASISLTHNPSIGNNHPVGFGTCLNENDGVYSGEAILLHGKARMTFDNGIVQCVGGTGFELEASPSGLPSLTLNGTIIENTLLGVHAAAGSAALAKCTIQYNSTGVEQDSDGTNIGSIDLSGGAAGGNNVVACNGAPAGLIGVSVLNTTGQPLQASNVQWDTSGPDVFKCDSSLMNCTCELATCAAPAGADGMDAVYESTGTIVTTANGPAVGCIQ